MSSVESKMVKVGLPNLIFMFTIDQLASMMNVSEDTISNVYLYYQGRSTGMKKKHHMVAINIAPSDQTPNWRVSLEEFRTWLSRMGFRRKDMTSL